MWPALIDYLLKAQDGPAAPVGHRAEADRRRPADDRRRAGGQRARPRLEDEAVHRRRGIVRADRRARRARTCSRTENAELFRLAIGGYGLFGAISTVKLRLIPRQKIQRVVEVRTIDDLPKAFEQRIADGFMFGDFQFSVDETVGRLPAKGRVLLLPAGRSGRRRCPTLSASSSTRTGTRCCCSRTTTRRRHSIGIRSTTCPRRARFTGRTRIR